MIRAYRLYTGEDGNSHVMKGTVPLGEAVATLSVSFAETPPHSSLDWHNDPEPQYVVTLAGTLEFETKTGETFTLRPGEILIAQDHTGTGHRWRLVDDEPWRRVYVAYAPGAELRFTPETR